MDDNVVRQRVIPLTMLKVASRFYFGVSMFLIIIFLSSAYCYSATMHNQQKNLTSPMLVVQMGHSGAINSAALSPDRKYAVSGSDDGTVKIWDVASGREIRTLHGHTGRVLSVAISRDGEFILSGSESRVTDLPNVDDFLKSLDTIPIDITEDSNILLWDKAGKKIKSFVGHRGFVNSIGFCKDTDRIISTDEQSIKLWEIDNGKEIKSLDTGLKGPGSPTAFTSDCTNAITASNKTIKLWDLITSKQSGQIEDNGGLISAIAISESGNLIVSGHSDGAIKIWDVKTGKIIDSFHGGTQAITAITISTDESYITAGSYDGLVKIWGVKDGMEVSKCKGHEYNVLSVTFSKDGMFVLSAGGDKTISLCEAKTGKEIRNFHGYIKNPIVSVNYLLDKNYIMVTDTRGVGLWDIAKGKVSDRFPNPVMTFSDIVYSSDRKHVFYASGNTLGMVETKTGKLEKTFDGYWAPISSIALSHNGRYIAAGSLGNDIVKLWDVETGKDAGSYDCGKTEDFFYGTVLSVAFSPDDNVIAISCYKPGLVLWDLATRHKRIMKDYS